MSEIPDVKDPLKELWDGRTMIDYLEFYEREVDVDCPELNKAIYAALLYCGHIPTVKIEEIKPKLVTTHLRVIEEFRDKVVLEGCAWGFPTRPFVEIKVRIPAR